MTDPFDGREVITRAPAYLTKAFGKDLPEPRLISGVNECLLPDNTTVFECDEGDYVNADLDRVIRHRSKHAPSSRKYPPDVLAKVLQYREIERAKGIRSSSERVAARLNREGVPRLDHTPWLAAHISSLGQAHAAEYEEQQGKEVVKVTKAVEVKVLPTMTARETAIAIATKLGQARQLLAEIAAMEAVFGCDHEDYDEMKAKATMLDQMRSFMGEGK